MKKRIAKLIVVMGILAALTLLLSIGAMAEDISGTMSVAPQVLTGVATVRVNISIGNVSDSGTPISVTLYDPDGKICSEFGSGGTANLSAGSSQTYTGNWTVTQSQLDAGRIIYSARYTTTNEDGEKVSTSRPISGTISHNAVKALLNIKRFVEPDEKVTSGQEVTIRYVIKNVGTVDVSDITIKDPDIISTPVTHAALKVDETTEMTYSYTAEDAAKVSHAAITYKYELNGKTETSKELLADPAVTINVEVTNLIITLSAEQIVKPGDKVEIAYKIENKSDLAYEKIKITDKLLGDIDSNISIGAKKTHEDTYSLTVNQTGTYQFTISGVDNSGNAVSFTSNELTIQTTDMLDESLTASPEFEIVIEADRDVIYAEPAEVIFRVKVTNNSDVVAKDVIIAAAGRTVKEYERIEPGETVDLLKALSVSMAGQFQFTATTKANTDKDNVSVSNIYRISYMPPPVAPATPVPAPTATPVPIVEETPDVGQPMPFTPPEDTGRSGSVVVYILGGLLAVIVIAVGVLFVLDQRRNGKIGGGARKGQARAIDTLERSTHRDYTRPAKKPAANAKRATPAEEAVEAEEEPLIPPRTFTPPVRKEAAPAPEEPMPDDDPFRAYDDMLPDYTPPAQEPVTFTPTRKREIPDTEQIFKRPEPEDAPPMPPPLASVIDDIPEAFESEPEPAPPTDGSENDFVPTENTAVFQRNYLSRIRDASAGAGSAGSVDMFSAEDDKPARPTLSEEEAAMLSGSTGQYRLSRRSASVRGGERVPTRERAEDPEAFARRQRADRAKSRTNSLANFYDDEEDGLAPPPPKKRR